MRVEHWNEETDGLLSEATLRRKLERRGYRVMRYVYPPGTVFPEHTHSIEKIEGVLSGRFRMAVRTGDHVQNVILGPGDLLAVPRGTLHSAAVLGDEAVISLDGTAP